MKKFINRLYNNQGGQLLISVIMTALCFAVLYLTHDVYWYSADDVEAMSLVSGAFTGEPVFSSPFLNVFLGYFFTFLYSITSTISWYTIFHITLIFVSAVSIFRLSFLIFNKKNISVIVPTILCVLLFFAVFTHSILYMVFTVNAILIGCAAIALLFIADINYDNKLRYLDYALSGLCLLLSFLLRYNCGSIIVCFWLLVIAYIVVKRFKKNKKDLVRILKLILFSIVVIILAFLLNKASRNIRANYESDYFMKFNSNRSEFLDYESVSWYTDPEFYETIGWDEELYFLVKNSWFFMDERLNLESLIQINNHTVEGGYTLSLKEKIYRVYDITVVNQHGLTITLVIISFFIAIVLLFFLSKEKKKNLLKFMLALCACGGAAIMIAYLCLNGRFMLHIYKTVSFPLIIVLAAVLFTFIDKCNVKNIINNVVIIILSLILAVSAGISLKSSYVSNAPLHQNWSKSMQELEEYAYNNPDKIFIHNNFVNLNAFPTYNENTQTASNMIRWGTCIYYSEAYYDFWNSHGYYDFCSENFYDDNVYLAISPYAIGVDIDIIENYFNNKFGETEFIEVYKTENLVIFDINKA